MMNLKQKSRHKEIVTTLMTDDVSPEVANMIADLQIRMHKTGQTQEQIADECGWYQPQLSDYLRGVKSPGMENLAKLAKAIGCRWILTPLKNRR